MYSIRHVKSCDETFWFTLDGHISRNEFHNKVQDGQGYVLLSDGRPVAILRYNLFWDNTPFCNLVYVVREYQGQGLGKQIMSHWESEMRLLGYKTLLVSTRSDESAQFFFRAIGYKDCGSMQMPDQADELFLRKDVGVR